MPTHKKLGQIADIQFGLHQSSQIKGEVKYLLVRHFDENLRPTLFEESHLNMDARVQKALLAPGDLLFAGKGYRQFAWTYEEAFGPTVASSVFYIIRPDPTILLPQYLTILLNTEKMRHTFRLIGLGVATPSIPKAELKEIKIPILPLAEQQRIVELAELHHQQIILTKRILQKKKDIFKSLIQKTINT